MKLSTRLHDRDAAGMTYVYPVVSRRARGVSIGVNLNPNNACNWRCLYCQVPGLTFGKGPAIDLELLRNELVRMLTAVVRGDYFERHVPPEARRLNDVAFSGNGEPTGSPDFGAAVEVVGSVLGDFELAGELKVILITNGSLLHRPAVQAGVRSLAALGGEVWYKLDSATDAGAAELNNAGAGTERALDNLRAAAGLCPTWIQTLMLQLDGAPPSEAERRAYLGALETLMAEGVALEGVHLYGLERASHQPEAPRLAALPAGWLEAFGDEIRTRGLRVRVSP